jgi:hypothetical protein
MLFRDGVEFKAEWFAMARETSSRINQQTSAFILTSEFRCGPPKTDYVCVSRSLARKRIQIARQGAAKRRSGGPHFFLVELS